MLTLLSLSRALPACCYCCRLDKSVNTLTTERALLALVSLWNRVPFSSGTWSFSSLLGGSVAGLLGRQATPEHDNPLRDDIEEFFEDFSEEAGHRRHMGALEGTSLADVIMRADDAFDWSSLPAEAGKQQLQLPVGLLLPAWQCQLPASAS